MAATAAKVASSSKAKEKPFSFFKGFGVPLIGFAVGWGGYSLMEQYQLVDMSVIQWTHLYNLKLQRLVQQQLPEVIGQRMTFTKEQLDAMILHLEVAASGKEPANAQAERVPFKKILGDCRPQEQMEWLTDHVSEDVPYFFIADIFHSWAELHENAFILDPDTKIAEAASPLFDSKELTHGVWKKMISEVIPFDVAVRVLCVLTRLGPQNAAWVNGLHSDGGNGAKMNAIDTILKLHKTYHQELNISGHEGGNVVPAATVDAATAVLLTTLNDAAVHGRRFPWIGRSPSGPFPLLSAARRDQWCGQLSSVSGDCLVSGMRIDQATTAHYNCPK